MSCNQKKNNLLSHSDNIQLAKGKDDSLVSKWKSDSLGCRHLRTIETGKEIFDKYKNEGRLKDTIDLKLIFGNPNKRTLLDDKKINFTYYINMCCDNNLYLEECDYSFVSIIFNEESNVLIFNSGVL